jgi:hypothetical protein
MIKEISPSVLPKLDACPVFKSTEGFSTAAQRGTDLDAAIRHLLIDDPTHYDALAPEDKPIAKWGAEKLRELAGGYHVETREEYLAMHCPLLSQSGTADAVCIRAGWVADIKSGQARDYKAQLAAYSLACMDDHFTDEWTAHVVYIDQQTVRSYPFTRATAELTLGRILERATSPTAEPTPCEYCSWCAHRDSCKALVKQSTEAIALVASPTSLTEIRDRLLANPVELSAFAANWKTAEKEIAKPLLDALKTRLIEGEDIPGWKVSQSAGRQFVETVAIAKAAASISRETLILSMGGSMSAEKYFALCAESGVEVDHSAVKQGTAISTLRQIKIKN